MLVHSLEVELLVPTHRASAASASAERSAFARITESCKVCRMFLRSHRGVHKVCGGDLVWMVWF